MRGSVQHDTVQLLDKYSISEILDAIMDVAADELVHEMRMWFDKEFNEGERLESALDKDVIEYVTHELEHHNTRLVKLEKKVFPTPTEPVRLPDDIAEELSKQTINSTVKKLKERERTILPHKNQEK
jgi:hypothetical protein